MGHAPESAFRQRSAADGDHKAQAIIESGGSMKQVVQNYRTGELKVDDVPSPTLRSGGLLIANRFSLISAGTEMATISVAKKNIVGKALDRPDMVKKVLAKAKKDGLVDTMKMVFARLDSPAALGYSCAGVVMGVGDRTDGFSVGDRVACAGQNFASHAEVIYVPKNLCVKIPDKVELEDGAYVALGAIALQGIRQADPKLGDNVVVIGLGLLGQLSVQMLKANGCTVVASDIDTSKLMLARRLGADQAVPLSDLMDSVAVLTGGHGADAVIITASTKDDGPVRLAGQLCRKKGRVVVVGAVGMTLPREPYYLKELELRLSTSYGPGRYDSEYEEKGNDYPYGYVRWTEKRNMEAFLLLIQQGRLNIRELTSHRFEIKDAEQAYKLMMQRAEPYLGILLSYAAAPASDQERKIEVTRGKPLARLNIGLIGAGNHMKDMLVPPLEKIAGVQLRAVCTGTGISAKALAERLRASYCTSDFHEVLQDREVDAVLIGTRHNLHASMVIEALKAGKHVFVEKPLCLTEDELKQIDDTYMRQAEHGQHLMVGFNRRYSSHGLKAREFFDGRRDPLVMAFRVNAGAIPPGHWIQDPVVGGRRIVGEVCHFIDYMQFVCGAKPVSAHARCVAKHSSGITDDHSILSFTFADGSVGTVIYAAGGDSALPKERFEVFGDGKSLVMDDFATTYFYENGKERRYRLGKRDKGFDNELTQFARAIMDAAAPPPMGYDEIRAVTRASILAAKSLQTGEVYAI
jgi:predicted dehydrogenase/threonine dehydrogenase-like Zn-dependent dehydrogenase